MRKDSARIRDVRDAARRLTQYVAGMTEVEFLVDEKTQAAVVREFEIMGEAASHVSAAYTSGHPEVQWQKMVELRNFFIHGYGSVNYSRVWRTASNLVPGVLAAIEPLCVSEDGGV